MSRKRCIGRGVARWFVGHCGSVRAVRAGRRYSRGGRETTSRSRDAAGRTDSGVRTTKGVEL